MLPRPTAGLLVLRRAEIATLRSILIGAGREDARGARANADVVLPTNVSSMRLPSTHRFPIYRERPAIQLCILELQWMRTSGGTRAGARSSSAVVIDGVNNSWLSERSIARLAVR